MHKAIKKRADNRLHRLGLEAELDQAVETGDIDKIKELRAALRAVAPKSNGRSSSSKYRDPHDPELVSLYEHRTVLSILAEFAKEIRMDFGYLGVVPGLDAIVIEASQAAHEPVPLALRRELCRRLYAKLAERTHGMGALYVERGNQAIRKLYEHQEVVAALGLPVDGDRPWLGRRERGDYGAEFAEKWDEHVREMSVDQPEAEPDDQEPDPRFEPEAVDSEVV